MTAATKKKTRSRSRGSRPRSSSTLPEPFTRGICNRLRRLSEHRDKAIIAKKEAIAGRDDVATKIAKTDASQGKTLERLKIQHYDWCELISEANANLRHIEGETFKSIKAGDDLELIETVDPDPTFDDLVEERVLAIANKNTLRNAKAEKSDPPAGESAESVEDDEDEDEDE